MLLVLISYNFVLIIGYILNQLICNNHTKNFYNYITKLLNECNAFYFNVAFINFSGIQLLLESFKSLENKKLDVEINYDGIEGLRLEARQKLMEIKPSSIGQASRISGVSPADINVLLIYLEQQKRLRREQNADK